MNKKLVLVAVLVLIAVGGLVLLLATGGEETPATLADPAGDVVLDDGSNPPDDITLADLRNAEVVQDGADIIFRATFATQLPSKMRPGELEVRWDVAEEGVDTWQVSARIDQLGLAAAIVSNETDYGAGTFDDSFPGEARIVGDQLLLRIRPGDVPQFPSGFDWRLSTSLDGDSGNIESARAEDEAPNAGSGRFGTPG